MNHKTFKEFKAICQPLDKITSDPIIGKLFYRKLSNYLTFLFVWSGFSANMVSLLGIFIALAGISLFALTPDVRLHFVGVILLQVSIFVDYSDGEVARYRIHESGHRKEDSNISGAFMDNMGHYIVNPLVLFFFGYRAIHHFNDWSVLILVLGFLTAMAGQGIPNLVMSDMIVNSIRKKPEVMDNRSFRIIASGRINVMLDEGNQLSRLERVLLSIANFYKGIDVIGIISLGILIELLLSWLGFHKIAMYFGLGVFLSLFILLTLNFIRTFRRNFSYLSKPF
jgi:hypothetical protein